MSQREGESKSEVEELEYVGGRGVKRGIGFVQLNVEGINGGY